MSTQELKDFTIKDVGIFERLHESSVVMSILTGMNTNDVMLKYLLTG